MLTVALIAGLSACSVTPRRAAPVEDRPISGVRPVAPSASAPTQAASAPTDAKPLPGAENAGKPGYYTVKSGDTLIRIALDNGQNWRDLVKWNGLDKPNVIEVGQVLRVVPPGVDPTAVATRPVTTGKVETRPLDGKPVAGAASAPAGASAPIAPATPAPAATAARDSDDEPAWGWPVGSPVSAGFDEQRNKGLDFNGKAGEPVLAAADGRVMYAGSGLRGYGNMVIIKHNNSYLTAYAHNQTLLVKEDQAVRKGQKIAEMGSSDADQVMLHFEVRKQGKPIDPSKLLPAR
ncbi:peptidoglycan DD-metalloendopeptidase family protein [Paucibacter sp. R3-3]|uniref:Peptidoglycan DD-metalloendopeptidase family protein n=1 Tax=Roseateles agri TaxID=3098619 RepID=A0ABU5DNJ8_9BURK|nr:peptidoglycan DD-metalloendopeptidase family protein [Paucibacter sp. R3-3]MDY0746637.1 peptidoglycan DD-metalloendopeptidase family protein [Paucibacter sp. R3-3]